MGFGPSENQLLFKENLKSFLPPRSPTAPVRPPMGGGGGGGEQRRAELGVAGVLAPAAQGGLERELLDLALVAEELGYAATPGPFLGAAMATVALVEGGDATLHQHWLEAMASGDAIGTVAWGEENGE